MICPIENDPLSRISRIRSLGEELLYGIVDAGIFDAH